MQATGAAVVVAQLDPAGQVVQVAAPRLYVPAAHAVGGPAAVVCVPAGAAVHDADPAAAYVLAAHAEHAVAPDDEKVPAAQGSHWRRVAGLEEDVPAGHACAPSVGSGQ